MEDEAGKAFHGQNLGHIDSHSGQKHPAKDKLAETEVQLLSKQVLT